MPELDDFLVAKKAFETRYAKVKEKDVTSFYVHRIGFVLPELLKDNVPKAKQRELFVEIGGIVLAALDMLSKRK